MSHETLPAGPTLDLLVAEKVMGWTWIQPPQWDYDGPLPQQEKILAPPGWDDERKRTGWQWPPKGVIPVGFLLREKYSTSMVDAWEVVIHMSRRKDLDCRWWNLTAGSFISIDIGEALPMSLARIMHDCPERMPLAICRAALMAVTP